MTAVTTRAIGTPPAAVKSKSVLDLEVVQFGISSRSVMSASALSRATASE